MASPKDKLYTKYNLTAKLPLIRVHNIQHEDLRTRFKFNRLHVRQVEGDINYDKTSKTYRPAKEKEKTT